MDHIKILKRAFSITWNYRVLWVFGFLLALTLPRGGGSSNSGAQFGSNTLNGIQGFPPYFPAISPQVINTIITAAIALICVIFLLAIAATIVRYVSETALIRLVDHNEATMEKVNVQTGFRMGWSRRAFRLFLIDLLFGVVGIVAFLLLLLVAASPFLVWLTKSNLLRTLGTVAGIGFVFLVILLFILIAIILSVVMQFIHRAAVLEDLGVFASIERGFVLVRQRLGDVVIMALILFALGLGLAVLSIPLFILLLLAAVVIGGLPALLAGLITSLFAQGYLPWIIVALVGLPIFLVVLVVPGSFVSGLVQVFTSSTWTLTYREVLALGGRRPEAQAQPPETPQTKAGESAVASQG
jgi:hypothetical protein